MADYTLGVEVTGDASSMQKEFNKAQKAVEDLKKKTEEANKTASGTFSEMSKSIGDTSEKLKSFGDKMTELGGKVRGVGIGLTAGLTTPIVMAGKKMFEAASDYQENLNKVDVAFKNNSKQVKTWANNATKQFGLSKNAALEMTSLFGDMGTSMGLSTGESAKMSTSLAGLAGDLSSFKNIPVEEAMTALNGVFTGETESLKRLGIVMTEANLAQYALAKGYGKSYDEMSQAEKVQLRYAYVTDMSKNAVGDYERTSDGAANTMRTFKSSVENLATTLGQNLLPLITPIVKKMTKLVESFGKMDSDTQKKILAIAGAIAVLGPTLIILGQAISAIGAIASVFGTIGGAIASVIGWFGALTAEGGALAGVFGSLGAGPIIAIFAGIVVVIAGVVGAFKRLWDNSEQFRASIGTLAETIKIQFGNILNAIMPVVEPVIALFKQMWDSLVTLLEPVIAAVIPIITSIISIIGNTITTILAIVVPIFAVLVQYITAWIAMVTPILSTIIGVVMLIITSVVSAINVFVTTASAIIQALVSAIGAIIAPVVDFFAGIFNAIATVVKNVFTGISNFITTSISTIGNVVNKLVNVFSSVFSGIKGIVNSAMSGVTGAITGAFDKIKSSWSGLTGFVQGVFNGISSAVQSLVGQVKGFVNGVIGGINSAVSLINKIPGVSIGAIPYLARGTDNWQGGFARMNEGGRGELTYLPGGSVVVPHDISMKYAKESARSQSGMVMIGGNDEIVKSALKVASDAVKRPTVLNVNGRDLAYTTGNDFTNYQNNQAVQIKRLRGEV